jgi:DNA-directed RNA polymerase subunit RPC12/RpoP
MYENNCSKCGITFETKNPKRIICPDCLYKLMQRCWQDDRTLRPKFPEIVLILDEMFHFPEETKKLTKIREVNPINPRQPTKIQLTSTKQFLIRLNLEQYLENFQRCGLSNLSNLFQLEPKDLSYSLGVHSQYDQKKIMDELKSISISFSQSLGQSHNQNSYQPQPVALNNLNKHANTLNLNDAKVINNFNTCLKTLKLNQEQQQKQSSIFHLIRNKNENVNNQINNDLLLFSNPHMSTLAQNFTNSGGGGGGGGAEESSGYFV